MCFQAIPPRQMHYITKAFQAGYEAPFVLLSEIYQATLATTAGLWRACCTNKAQKEQIPTGADLLSEGSKSRSLLSKFVPYMHLELQCI